MIPVLGGDIGGNKLNHLCYADDICLISLFSSEMQRLLDICSNYISEHSLLYNSSKSYSCCYKPKKIKFKSPSLYLDHSKIPVVFHICDIDLKGK